MGEYARLGVDADKRAVRAFESALRPLFPRAFTTVVRGRKEGEGFVLHVDGAGSKPVVAYLYYKETGDPAWFRSLAQDVVAMNVDDVVAVGAEPELFADYVAVNAFRLPREEVLGELSRGFRETLGTLARLGAGLRRRLAPEFAGGETADLPDQVRTLDVVGVVFARVELSEAVSGERVAPGDVIVGLRSGGKAKYERGPNSGIMCNGLTLARHVLLSRDYASKYPETYEPSSRAAYRGRFKVDDYVDELGATVGEALLSPTRLYAPVAAEVLERCGACVKAMVHVTGGGLTKVLRVGAGVRYVKDNLPEPDPIFRLVQREGRIPWDEMYRVFNMGVGFEVVVEGGCADDVVDAAERYGVEAQVVGRVERGEPGANELVLKTREGVFRYRRELAARGEA